jgi:thiamine biosynthesis lipoprotein
MADRTPLRISHAGALGRGDFRALGVSVTVLCTRPAVTATAALAVRSGLEAIDRTAAATRARAADRVAAAAAAAAGCGVLVSIGGDVAVSGVAPEGGWRIRVADGVAPVPAQVRIQKGGVATAVSSAADATWSSVTVLASSCRMARAVAAEAVGRDAGARAWVESLGLTARFVGADGMVTFAGRWPTERAAA